MSHLTMPASVYVSSRPGILVPRRSQSLSNKIYGYDSVLSRLHYSRKKSEVANMNCIPLRAEGRQEYLLTRSRRRDAVLASALLALQFSVPLSGGERADAVAAAASSAAVAPPAEIFVAGATGRTGSLIVKDLLAKGFKVRAGVRDLERGKTLLEGAPEGSVKLVLVDVTNGSDSLVEAIRGVEAVVCATGFSPSADLTLAWKVDNLGTVNLVDACSKAGVRKFVLVSSLLTNAPAWGQFFNPGYLFLNLFGLVLVAKREAEKYIEKSGIDYTIVRPGGLSSAPPSGGLVLTAQDTLYEGSLSRQLVAEVAVQSLILPQASYKIVEIVSRDGAPSLSYEELFQSVP